MQSNNKGLDPAWTQVDGQTDAELWSRFDITFAFSRSDDLSQPVIRDPAHSVTFDLSGPDLPAVDGATFMAVETEALRCFVTALADVEELFVLNWQHTSHRFRPAVEAADLSPKSFRGEHPSVYPDGDYYAYVSPDFVEGTFGHPWEPSLCVFGPRMVHSLGRSLAGWLPIKRLGTEVSLSFPF